MLGLLALASSGRNNIEQDLKEKINFNSVGICYLKLGNYFLADDEICGNDCLHSSYLKTSNISKAYQQCKNF